MCPRQGSPCSSPIIRSRYSSSARYVNCSPPTAIFRYAHSQKRRALGLGDGAIVYARLVHLRSDRCLCLIVLIFHSISVHTLTEGENNGHCQFPPSPAPPHWIKVPIDEIQPKLYMIDIGQIQLLVALGRQLQTCTVAVAAA